MKIYTKSLFWINLFVLFNIIINVNSVSEIRKLINRKLNKVWPFDVSKERFPIVREIIHRNIVKKIKKTNNDRIMKLIKDNRKRITESDRLFVLALSREIIRSIKESHLLSLIDKVSKASINRRNNPRVQYMARSWLNKLNGSVYDDKYSRIIETKSKINHQEHNEFLKNFKSNNLINVTTSHTNSNKPLNRTLNESSLINTSMILTADKSNNISNNTNNNLTHAIITKNILNISTLDLSNTTSQDEFSNETHTNNYITDSFKQNSSVNLMQNNTLTKNISISDVSNVPKNIQKDENYISGAIRVVKSNISKPHVVSRVKRWSSSDFRWNKNQLVNDKYPLNVAFVNETNELTNPYHQLLTDDGIELFNGSYISFGNYKNTCISNLELCKYGLSFQLFIKLKKPKINHLPLCIIDTGASDPQSRGFSLFYLPDKTLFIKFALNSNTTWCYTYKIQNSNRIFETPTIFSAKWSKSTGIEFFINCQIISKQILSNTCNPCVNCYNTDHQTTLTVSKANNPSVIYSSNMHFYYLALYELKITEKQLFDECNSFQKEKRNFISRPDFKAIYPSPFSFTWPMPNNFNSSAIL